MSSDVPCSCCKCLECVSRERASIAECNKCHDNSPSRYLVNVGSWTEYPELGGTKTVRHVSGCTWESDDIEFVTVEADPEADPPVTEQTATYKYVLTQNGDDSSLELAWVEGDDPLGLDDETHTVKWTAVAPWTYLCQATMQAFNPEEFPSPPGLSCQICVIPYPFSCDCCFRIVIPDTGCPGLDGTHQFKWNTAYDAPLYGVCDFSVTGAWGGTAWGIIYDSEDNTIQLRNGVQTGYPGSTYQKTLASGEAVCKEHVVTRTAPGFPVTGTCGYPSDSITIEPINCPVLCVWQADGAGGWTNIFNPCEAAGGVCVEPLFSSSGTEMLAYNVCE